METLWHKVESAGNHDPLNPKNANLRFPGITILDQNEILFLLLPAQQWVGMFQIFRIGTSNGFTLYFIKKVILEQINTQRNDPGES